MTTLGHSPIFPDWLFHTVTPGCLLFTVWTLEATYFIYHPNAILCGISIPGTHK